ncbi:hypothetical protein [Brevibacillus laterosporus]|uniref:hypothetical protein n=1 Tax=Brevibacillus laterosporus TaxID=1465 RepID=UPI00215BB534|nr:hypothetical protein [Brevibacillus laterosporus]MCR8994611.1 hypothetical protein [Brevibacillus laterosporus]
MMKMKKVENLGYYIHKDYAELEPLNLMIIYEDCHEVHGKFLTMYNPVEAHREIGYDYFGECIQITKEQYLEASKGYYTPSEYL